MASPAHTEWGHTHTLELEEREAKRARLSEPPYHTPTPAPEGEPEVESDFEPDDHDQQDREDHEPEEPGAPKKKEKKKRVRTDRDRERDRERRRERDRARRARQAAEREEAAKAAAAETETTQSEAKEETEDGEYCICRGANGEEGGTMVGCETCDNWFHPTCVGLDEGQVDMLDVYICAGCEENTSRRTSYRRVCRAGCGRAARSTSKFCSSRCAFAHARSLLAGVEKKDAKALEAALSAYPSPAPSVSVDRPGAGEEHDRAVLEGAQDAATLALLSSLRRQGADAERALAILARRQAMLASAVGVWESLAPGAVDEPKKRSKNKKRDGEKDPRPCGYDSRLVWSDAQVAGWDGSEREVSPPLEEEGEGKKESALERAARLGLCAVGRRCERHAGWQKTLAVQLEVEATQLARRRDELATLGERIERAGTTTVAARRARDGVHAALAAKQAAKA